jgi:transglutaminase-like putative cysteine protease
MLPATDHSQIVLAASLNINPPSHQHPYVDYWGTVVSMFEVVVPHTELSVEAVSVIDVRENRYRPVDTTWDYLGQSERSSSECVEALLMTPLTEPASDLAKLAKEIRQTSSSPGEAARRIAQLVNGSIDYVKGATGVHSTARDSWVGRKGVCQDFAHITIGALRAIGIPARYVSGYLHPQPDAPIGEPVPGESHAWVEWYTGGWYGFDPTNMSEIGPHHVHVARGRDYSDVSPLRGVYSGEGASDSFVSVSITREA